MRNVFVLCALVVVFSAGHVWGGPYSNHSNDSGNAIDAPIAASDPMIVAWANAVVDYSPSPGVTNDEFAINDDPASALGPAGGAFNGQGQATRTVALGELGQGQIDAGVAPGSITLSFANPITDGPGHDFAVFENGFSNSFGGDGTFVFGELAFVEVSTDGVNFARFAAISSHGLADVDASFATPGTHDFIFFDPTGVHNLAGKHLADWGTPFDLSELTTDPLVQSGDLALGEINFVRIVDVPGSGDFLDDQSSAIYDSWETTVGGGFDLDAVGVINQVPEPAMMFVVAVGMVLGVARRRR